MNIQKHKNKYLTLASSLAVPAIVMLTKGQLIEGGILAVISVTLVAVYAYFDDKSKGAPALPEGVNEELLRKLAEEGADVVEDELDQRQNDS